MEQRKLEDIATFEAGLNTSRNNPEQEGIILQPYDIASFESDFHYQEAMDQTVLASTPANEFVLEGGEVIINNASQLAAIVNRGNRGKFLTSNFTRLTFDKNVLDKQYFLYVFNVYSEVQRQKEREMQGSIVKRITLASLKKLIIPIVPLEQQQQTGKIYSEMVKLQSQLSNYSNLLGAFSESILSDTIKNSGKDGSHGNG